MRSLRRAPRFFNRATTPKGDVLIFRAHCFSTGTYRAFKKLTDEIPRDFDMWIVAESEDRNALVPFGHKKIATYSRSDLERLPYPSKLKPDHWVGSGGHNDLPVLQFYREYPNYARYWVVEYDVRFTGYWGDVLKDLLRSTADVLGTTVQTYKDNPGWAGWVTINAQPESVRQECFIKSFVPFGRVSNLALEAIDAGYHRGWTGHFEGTWPTLAKLAGLTVEDIGANGRFTPEARRGRYYWNSPLDPYLRPGSFVFRPVEAGQDDAGWAGKSIDAIEWARHHLKAPDTLVHPVKE